MKLEKHIIDNHDIKKKDIVGSYLHTKALAQRTNVQIVFTDLEQDFVAVVAGDNTQCECTHCNKQMHKRTAETHFTKTHGIAPDVVKQWLVVKDGHYIKNRQWFKCSRLEAAYDDLEPGGGDMDGDDVGEVQDGDEAAAEVPPIPDQQRVDDHGLAAIAAQLTGIREQLAAAKQVEIEIPTMALTSFVKKWSHDDLRAGPAGYNQCPMPENHDHDEDLAGLEMWLNEKNIIESTIHGILQSCRRFFALCRCEAGAFSLPGVIIALYQQHMFPELFRNDVLDTRYSWTRKISEALTHLCNYCSLQLGVDRHWQAQNIVNQIATESLCGIKQKTSAQKKRSGRAKGRTDAAVLAEFASADQIKVAVKQAMVDLHNIKVNHPSEPLPPAARSAANTAMVGIIYLNGFAGRSGEWQRMDKAHVQKQIHMGANHLVCSDHKTSEQYGDLAKGVSPGTFRAMQVYMSLPGMASPLFLQPITSKAKHCSVHKCLPTFGHRYLHGSATPKCNIIRKLFHVKLDDMHRQGQHLDILSKVDAHSVKVIKDVYIVRTFEDDAKLGMLLYKQVMGDPVAWPADEEIAIDDDRWAIACKQAAEELDDDDAASDDENMCDITNAALQELLSSLINWKQSTHASTAPLMAPTETCGLTPKDEPIDDAEPCDAIVGQEDPSTLAAQSSASPGDPSGKRHRGRQSLLTIDEQAYIVVESQKLGAGAPPNSKIRRMNSNIRRIIRDGITNGKLREDVGFDQVRWVCRMATKGAK